jgi:membrane dipeptidase
MANIPIVDLHCDALLKLWYQKGNLSFQNAEELDANKDRLQQGGVKVQCFAIYTPADMKAEQNCFWKRDYRFP